MAQLIINPETRPGDLGHMIAQKLPDDFLVIEKATLNSKEPAIRFDLVVIKPTAVFVADIGSDRLIGDPNKNMKYSGELSQIRLKAQNFYNRVRSQEIASKVFQDPRVASSLWILPVLISTSSVLTSQSEVIRPNVPRYFEVSDFIEFAISSRSSGRYCLLGKEEIDRLGNLLAGIDPNRRRVLDAIEQAERYFSAHNFNRAIQQLEAINNLVPHDLREKVDRLLLQAKAEYNLEQAHEAMDIGNFDQAVKLSEAALTLCPNYSIAIDLRNQAQIQSDRAIKALGFIEHRIRDLENIELGIVNLNEIWELIPYNTVQSFGSEIQDIQFTLQTQKELIHRAEVEIREEDLLTGLSDLQQAKRRERELSQQLSGVIEDLIEKTPLRFAGKGAARLNRSFVELVFRQK